MWETVLTLGIKKVSELDAGNSMGILYRKWSWKWCQYWTWETMHIFSVGNGAGNSVGIGCKKGCGHWVPEIVRPLGVGNTAGNWCKKWCRHWVRVLDEGFGCGLQYRHWMWKRLQEFHTGNSVVIGCWYWCTHWVWETVHRKGEKCDLVGCMGK